MRRVLIALIVLISLGLCGVCVVQWQREFRLRETIASLTAKLIEENKQRIAAEEKVEQYSQEIERLNGIRMDIEAKLLTTTEELRDRTLDQTARGFSIAILMNETIRSTSELAGAGACLSMIALACSNRRSFSASSSASTLARRLSRHMSPTSPQPSSTTRSRLLQNLESAMVCLLRSIQEPTGHLMGSERRAAVGLSDDLGRQVLEHRGNRWRNQSSVIQTIAVHIKAAM